LEVMHRILAWPASRAGAASRWPRGGERARLLVPTTVRKDVEGFARPVPGNV
jgi:hypothetical protein